MASTYTDSNRLTKQGSGENENTWGLILNAVIDLTDTSLDGVAVIDVSAGDVTLTTVNGAADQARNRVLKTTGSPGVQRNITIPDKNKTYFIDNLLVSSSVNVKNVSGTGVVVNPNTAAIVYCDSTSTRALYQPSQASLLRTNNLSDLTNVSAALGNLGVTSVATSPLTSLLASVYPVGSIYYNATNSANPSTLFGFGTWVAITDTFILAAGSTYTAGSSGGAATVMLSAGNIPSVAVSGSLTQKYSNFNVQNGGAQAANILVAGANSFTFSGSTAAGSDPVANMPPYIAVYVWKRTA